MNKGILISAAVIFLGCQNQKVDIWHSAHFDTLEVCEKIVGDAAMRRQAFLSQKKRFDPQIKCVAWNDEFVGQYKVDKQVSNPSRHPDNAIFDVEIFWERLSPGEMESSWRESSHPEPAVEQAQTERKVP